jgi:hypothetical protein
MDKEQYQAWASHPQTVQFFQFLMDYRADIMEKWANGFFVGDVAEAYKHKAQFAFQLVNLDDDAIGEFYRNQKGEVKDVE